ncbi:hypothetical protein [Cyanobium sp. NIES-981]|uniref:hypothetical protein n=1 Tax=Cyanobium sp. NIES-981 TaxID=1851505 RepID=UPI001CEC2853|nr:hypothetical protein [Cyanobium sp. NIES-981]
MADETSTSSPQGGRPGGNREPGGFRIRLSDNEMRAARAVQDAFQLRSTVAVLGFCVRTLAQLLEDGKLDELVSEARSQAGSRDPGRGGRRGEGRSEARSEGRGEARSEGRGSRTDRSARIDPFARPSRPKPAPEPVEPAALEPTPEQPAAVEASAEPEASTTTADEPATRQED